MLCSSAPLRKVPGAGRSEEERERGGRCEKPVDPRRAGEAGKTWPRAPSTPNWVRGLEIKGGYYICLQDSLVTLPTKQGSRYHVIQVVINGQQTWSHFWLLPPLLGTNQPLQTRAFRNPACLTSPREEYGGAVHSFPF